MSHGMEKHDKMFSVRLAPWHMGTGTNVTVLPDHPEPAKVLEHAGLNWQIEEKELFTGPGERVNGWKANFRSDTQEMLCVVTERFTNIQNEVGAEVMEALLSGGEGTELEGKVKYETGGSVRDGRFCYLSAKIEEDLAPNGDSSAVFPYCVVTWGHDGLDALVARSTNVRVVCQNTISAAEAESQRTGRRWSFRHSSNWRARLDEAKAALSGALGDAKRFQELANELGTLKITKRQRELFVTEFIPAPVGAVVSDRVLTNIETARDTVRELFAPGNVTIPDDHKSTGYGLLLAGTEYLDHLRGYRNSDTLVGRTLLREESLKGKLVPMIKELASA